MTPIQAALFNAAGQAWASVNQLEELIPSMLQADDTGWVRDCERRTSTGAVTHLSDLGSYSLDPDTREILLDSRAEPI